MGDVRAFRRGEVDDAVAGVRELVDQGAEGFVVLAVFGNGDSIADWTFGKVSSASAAFMSIILTDLALESRRRNVQEARHERPVVRENPKVDDAEDLLLRMPVNERMEVFARFCSGCGTANLPCYCWNDE